MKLYSSDKTKSWNNYSKMMSHTVNEIKTVRKNSMRLIQTVNNFFMYMYLNDKQYIAHSPVFHLQKFSI